MPGFLQTGFIRRHTDGFARLYGQAVPFARVKIKSFCATDQLQTDSLRIIINALQNIHKHLLYQGMFRQNPHQVSFLNMKFHYQK